MFILDTNTLIYFFKGVGEVSRHLLSTPPVEIGLPTIVLFELEVGIGKSKSPEKRRAQLHEFASMIMVFPFGREEASSAALIRIRLEAKGFPIGPYDVLIAATAMANNATLITHNKKEFERIEGLNIEDWFD